jgi:penicillin-binding protein 1A
MKWLIKLLKISLWLGFLGGIVGVIGIASLYFYLEPSLPTTENLKNVKFQVPLRVYSKDRRLIAEFGEKRRDPLTYDQIPEQMIQAFLAAEDDRFFEHPGVDYQGILRAAYQLLMTGERRQGGSTITMQVARNFYLSREKTFTRKLNEIFLSFRIEQDLTKQEILELYLNKIYMGHRAYGVGAAANVYYGKGVDELELPQIAMIAGLPKAPSRFNPVTDPERAKQRRNYVLGRMAQLDFITEEQMQNAKRAPVIASLHTAKAETEAPYIAEMVRAEMVDRFGNEAYTDGYTVHTTVDSRLQEAANLAVRKTLQAYDLRHGYRGPEQHFDLGISPSEADLDQILKDQPVVGNLPPALVTRVSEQDATLYLGQGQSLTLDWEGLEWAAPYIDENRRGAKPKSASEILKPGDLVRVIETQREKKEETYWRLAQIPAAEGALIALDPNDGSLISLVGGYDFYNSKFNRATQAKRQPGSGFKAIIYSAALEAGFTPASLINDAPVVFDDPSLEGAWRPENYSGKFFGPTRLRYALTKSRNLVSIRLLRTMGVKHALEHAARFGFNPDELPHNLSLALGSGAITPLQMATAYSVLANGGYRVDPYLIVSIENSSGETIYQAEPKTVCEECTDTAPNETAELPPAVEPAPESASAPDEARKNIAQRAISPQNHYLMNSMMRDVITQGTARRARSLGRQDLAGKTGTTNDQRDAWFNGFNRNLVAISWVGFDSSAPLGRGEVGGRAALPAWISFMEEALQGVEETPLKMPPGMVTVRIDPETGKRADSSQDNAIFEVFRAENAPKGPTTTGHQGGDTATTTGKKDSAAETDIF